MKAYSTGHTFYDIFFLVSPQPRSPPPPQSLHVAVFQSYLVYQLTEEHASQVLVPDTLVPASLHMSGISA